MPQLAAAGRLSFSGSLYGQPKICRKHFFAFGSPSYSQLTPRCAAFFAANSASGIVALESAGADPHAVYTSLTLMFRRELPITFGRLRRVRWPTAAQNGASRGKKGETRDFGELVGVGSVPGGANVTSLSIS